MIEKLLLGAAAVVIAGVTAATLIYVWFTFPFMRDTATAWGGLGMLAALLGMASLTRRSGGSRRSL